MIAVKVADGNSTVTFSSAATLFPPDPYALLTERRRTIASLPAGIGAAAMPGPDADVKFLINRFPTSR
jgi:hypothetical protein